MFLFPEAGDTPFVHAQHRLTERLFPQPWIALPLLLGLLLGSVMGLFASQPAGIVSSFAFDFAGGGFLYWLWIGSRFVIAALLLATTFLGFALLPGLSALYGFLFGWGVAAAFRADGFSGLLTAAVSLGIPALLSLPAFLLAASDGANCSLQLLRCFTRGERPIPDGQGAFLRHIALIVFLCFAEALYCAFLLPILRDAV